VVEEAEEVGELEAVGVQGVGVGEEEEGEDPGAGVPRDKDLLGQSAFFSSNKDPRDKQLYILFVFSCQCWSYKNCVLKAMNKRVL